MQSRKELIEEIVGEFDRNFGLEMSEIQERYATTTVGWTPNVGEKIKMLIRVALTRMSDASMDAVEVEEKRDAPLPDHTKKVVDFSRQLGWNSARTASQNKRANWIKE